MNENAVWAKCTKWKKISRQQIEDNKGNFFIKVFFPIFSAFYFEDKGRFFVG